MCLTGGDTWSGRSGCAHLWWQWWGWQTTGTFFLYPSTHFWYFMHAQCGNCICMHPHTCTYKLSHTFAHMHACMQWHACVHTHFKQFEWRQRSIKMWYILMHIGMFSWVIWYHACYSVYPFREYGYKLHKWLFIL